MNRDDAKKVLFILEDNYPSTYRNMITEQKIRQIDNYLEFFEEYDTPIIVVALKNYIKSNQYPPTIAGLQEQIDLLLDKGNTAEALWNKLYKAICNSTYNSVAEYEKLPVECQMWLGSPQGLKELGLTEIDKANTVLRGQFLKGISEISKRVKAQRGINPELKSLIERYKTNALLESPEEL